MVGLAATLVRLGDIEARPEWRAAIATPADAAGYYACIENGLSFGGLGRRRRGRDPWRQRRSRRVDLRTRRSRQRVAIRSHSPHRRRRGSRRLDVRHRVERRGCEEDRRRPGGLQPAVLAGQRAARSLEQRRAAGSRRSTRHWPRRPAPSSGCAALLCHQPARALTRRRGSAGPADALPQRRRADSRRGRRHPRRRSRAHRRAVGRFTVRRGSAAGQSGARNHRPRACGPDPGRVWRVELRRRLRRQRLGAGRDSRRVRLRGALAVGLPDAFSGA